MPTSRALILVFHSLAAVGASGALPCECARAYLFGGWCDACRVGYVAGVRIPSRMLYDTPDNHGHDVDLSLFKCESCQRAARSDGFCETCQLGFLRKQIYFSVFTYQIALGTPKEPAEISCPVCRKNVGRGGWCEACGVGMLGNIAVRDRKGFEAALPAFRRLQSALKHIDTCEICAVAMFSNGMCPKCQISFQDGEPVQEKDWTRD